MWLTSQVWPDVVKPFFKIMFYVFVNTAIIQVSAVCFHTYKALFKNSANREKILV